MAQVAVGAGAVRAETRRKLVRAKEERMKTSRDICGFMPCKEGVEQKMMEEIQVIPSLVIL